MWFTVFLTEYMKQNLNNNNIYQYFADVTYYATPTVCKTYKIFTILGFNIREKRTNLCALALISNENYETFNEIFKFLYNQYNFLPKFITIDFNKACFKAVLKLFPKTIIIPCYFHLMKICYKKLPELNKKCVNQKSALDLISNTKLLCFIKSNEVISFFNKIKNKFKRKFSHFLTYFEKNYIISKQYGIHSFNYSKLVEKDIPEDIKFYTNNIIESFHRTLNCKYVGGTKTFYHFKHALIEILDLYKYKNEYKNNKNSMTRVLAYYTMRNDIRDIIKYDTLKEIK